MRLNEIFPRNSKMTPAIIKDKKVTYSNSWLAINAIE